MKWTTKHYVDLGDAAAIGPSLLSEARWDAARLADEGSPLSLPKDRARWIQKGLESPEIEQRGAAVVRLVRDGRWRRVVSVGVGCAWLEYHVKSMEPSLQLTCSDYSPRSIERLRELFPECDAIEVFDMRSWHWPATAGTLWLMHRVDAEFDDVQWHDVFAAMRRSNVQSVLFVPGRPLTLRRWVSAQVNRWIHRRLGRPIALAGYLRTRDAIRALWVPHYRVVSELPVGDLTGFLLQPNE